MLMILFAFLLAQKPAFDASKITVGVARTVATVEAGKISGEPWRLAWSPDGSQLHLVAMKRQGPNTVLTHHVIDVTSGAVTKVEAEPEWASPYWTWKSGKASPADPQFAIQLEQQVKNESATARPMGGDFARGGASSASTGASIDEVAGQGSQNVMVITLLLKGEVLGQWKGEPFVPGLTFGWAPKSTPAVAYAAKDGRLALMDNEGRKQKIETTKDVRLPAWSTDGRQIGWIEKQDRNKFRVMVAGIE
jgi:hypothetical protein